MIHRSGESEEARKERQALTVEGKITEVLPNAMYAIELNDGQRVLGHVPGTLRITMVRVVPGDRVTLELSPYDLTRGRIVRNHRSA